MTNIKNRFYPIPARVVKWWQKEGKSEDEIERIRVAYLTDCIRRRSDLGRIYVKHKLRNGKVPTFDKLLELNSSFNISEISKQCNVSSAAIYFHFRKGAVKPIYHKKRSTV